MIGVMLAAILFVQEGFSAKDAAKLDAAIQALEPVQEEVLGAFSAPLAAPPVQLRPNRQCAQLNSEYGIVRPAFTDSRIPGTVFLCDPFFKRSVAEMSVVLGHELIHVSGGPDDDLGGKFSHQEGSAWITREVRRILRDAGIR